MTRNEYIQHKSNGTIPNGFIYKNTLRSITNPAHAQSVREMLTNPLPIVPRQIQYKEGVVADQMHAFDKMYPDKFDSHRAAKEITSKTINDLDKITNDLKQKENEVPSDN